MNLPSFECFLQTITAEKINQIVDDINKNVVDVTSKPKNLSSSIAKLHQQNVTQNFELTIALLREYHSWLAEQLDT